MPDKTEVIDHISEQVSLLVTRNWPAIEQIIEEEEEIKITFGVHINDREADAGEHSAKDKRLKTTLSFSTRVTDSTEATLDDPTQPGLFKQTGGQPGSHDYHPPDLTQPSQKPILPEGFEFVSDDSPQAGDFVFSDGQWHLWSEESDFFTFRARQTLITAHDVEHFPEAGDSAKEIEQTKAALVAAGGPVGTNIGDALAKAAAGAPLDRVQVDFPRGYGQDKYRGLFRKAAVKAKWPEPCIDLIDGLAKTAADGFAGSEAGLKALDVLRAHSDPKPKKPKAPAEPETVPAAPPVDPMADAPPGAVAMTGEAGSASPEVPAEARANVDPAPRSRRLAGINSGISDAPFVTHMKTTSETPFLDDDDNKLEVIPPGALEAITRGEIDVQISTAHKYPRSMSSFKKRGTDMATIDVETAESCIYVRPVGMKNGKQQYAEGLSVRMAEIVGASYGNLRVGSMIVEQTERHVITRGFAHDLETNFASTSECKEPTVTKEGRPFSEGMRAVIAKAALAKARRDATFQVVPKALCRPIEKAARALIAGDTKSLEDRKANAAQFVQRLNIDAGRVWAALGVTGADDLTSESLLTLAGLRTAIKDGDTNVDDAFPVVVAQGKVGSTPFTPPPAEGEPKPAKKKAETPAPKPDTEPEKPAAEEKPAPTGPTADELRAEIKAKAARSNIAQKSVFVGFLVEQEYLSAPEAYDTAPPETLAAILDDWDAIIAKSRE